jgi:rSAM/selenodomain-associated transferase 2
VGGRPQISVVIPALNEEALVAGAVRSVSAEAEVIVVDGGSRDRTVAAAQAAGACVLTASRGRGRQLAAGAAQAGGDWLLFLHADTRLEPGWAGCLRGLRLEIVGGAFRFAVDSPRQVYRWLEAGVRLRCALFSLAYGDQGIFVRREAYGLTGGFAPYPLMEDVAFMRRLRRTGALAFPDVRALTSPRRWERHGMISTSLRNWWLLGLYAAGWPPERLAHFYGERPA